MGIQIENVPEPAELPEIAKARQELIAHLAPVVHEQLQNSLEHGMAAQTFMWLVARSVDPNVAAQVAFRNTEVPSVIATDKALEQLRKEMAVARAAWLAQLRQDQPKVTKEHIVSVPLPQHVVWLIVLWVITLAALVFYTVLHIILWERPH